LDSALVYFDKAYQSHVKAHSEEGTAIALSATGRVYIEKSAYDSARIYIRQALDIDIRRGDSIGMIHDYNDLGLAFDYQSVNDSALIYYYRALRIAESINNEAYISQQMNNIAVVYMNMEDYENALTKFRSTLSIDLALGNRRGISTSYNNIGLIHDYRDQNDSALVYYFKALSIDTLLGSELRIANRYNNIGVIYEKIGDYEVAERYYLQALEIKEKVGNQERIASTLVNLGQVNIFMNRNDLAEIYFKRALQVSKEHSVLVWEKEAHEGLSQLYEIVGKYQKALQHHKLYKSVHDSIFNLEKEEIVRELEIQYETEANQREIFQQKLQIEKKKREQIQLFAGLAALALLVVFLILSNRKQKRRAERSLQRLRDTNAKLLENISSIEEQQKTPGRLAEHSFTLTTGGIQEIKLKDIIYIQAFGNGVTVHMIEGRHLEWESLKNIKEVLPKELFLQVHKSYLLNILYIKKRTKRSITLSSGELINIGATHRDKVERFFQD
ncbi:MAG: tetratricopeptide repeat protein, partial [Cyanobacteria bacterium J06649_11]